MVDRSKLFSLTLLMSMVVAIATFISWLLGFEGFLLIGTIVLPTWTICVIHMILFYITFVMWAGVSTNEYSLKLLKITCPYIVINIIVQYFLKGTVFSSAIFPFLYIMLLGLLRNDIKLTITRGLKYFVIVFVYELFASLMKTAILPYNQLDFSIYQVLAFSVDSLIFQGLLFLYGGELLRYVQLVSKFIRTRGLERNISAGAQVSNENSIEDDKILQEFNSLNSWDQKFTILMYMGIQLVQCIAVIGIINLVNIFLPGGSILIESIIILLSFGIHGLVLRERWHSKKIITCSLVSSTMFFIAAKVTPAFTLFQLLPVLMGLLLCYAMHEIKVMKKRKTYTKWRDTISDLTTGKYANIGNHQEVALAKGLTGRDLSLVGYNYSTSDTLSKFVGKISPWNDGKYTREEAPSE